MAGNRAGGLKSRDKILKANPNHYSDIGKVGGSQSAGGGFAYMKEVDPERHRKVSSAAGSAPKRKRTSTSQDHKSNQ